MGHLGDLDELERQQNKQAILRERTYALLQAAATIAAANVQRFQPDESGNIEINTVSSDVMVECFVDEALALLDEVERQMAKKARGE